MSDNEAVRIGEEQQKRENYFKTESERREAIARANEVEARVVESARATVEAQKGFNEQAEKWGRDDLKTSPEVMEKAQDALKSIEAQQTANLDENTIRVGDTVSATFMNPDSQLAELAVDHVSDIRNLSDPSDVLQKDATVVASYQLNADQWAQLNSSPEYSSAAVEPYIAGVSNQPGQANAVAFMPPQGVQQSPVIVIPGQEGQKPSYGVNVTAKPLENTQAIEQTQNVDMARQETPAPSAGPLEQAEAPKAATTGTEAKSSPSMPEKSPEPGNFHRGNSWGGAEKIAEAWSNYEAVQNDLGKRVDLARSNLEKAQENAMDIDKAKGVLDVAQANYQKAQSQGGDAGKEAKREMELAQNSYDRAQKSGMELEKAKYEMKMAENKFAQNEHAHAARSWAQTASFAKATVIGSSHDSQSQTKAESMRDHHRFQLHNLQEQQTELRRAYAEKLTNPAQLEQKAAITPEQKTPGVAVTENKQEAIKNDQLAPQPSQASNTVTPGQPQANAVDPQQATASVTQQEPQQGQAQAQPQAQHDAQKPGGKEEDKQLSEDQPQAAKTDSKEAEPSVTQQQSPITPDQSQVQNTNEEDKQMKADQPDQSQANEAKPDASSLPAAETAKIEEAPSITNQDKDGPVMDKTPKGQEPSQAKGEETDQDQSKSQEQSKDEYDPYARVRETEAQGQAIKENNAAKNIQSPADNTDELKEQSQQAQEYSQQYAEGEDRKKELTR